jgi:hypothetical protein
MSVAERSELPLTYSLFRAEVLATNIPISLTQGQTQSIPLKLPERVKRMTCFLIISHKGASAGSGTIHFKTNLVGQTDKSDKVVGTFGTTPETIVVAYVFAGDEAEIFIDGVGTAGYTDTILIVALQPVYPPLI